MHGYLRSVLLIPFFFGCSSVPCPGSSPEPGSTLDCGAGPLGLFGAAGFPVNYAFIDAVTPLVEDGDQTLLPGGGYGAIAIWLSDVDVRGKGGTLVPPMGRSAHLLRIEVAGPSYMGGAMLAPGATPEPMTPGPYYITFDGEDDDDLGNLLLGTSAILDVFDFGQDGGMYTQSAAYAGTVTFTLIAAGHVEGSFDVQLSSSPFVVKSITPLHGAFVATSP